MTSIGITRPHGLTGRHVLFILLGFFGSIATADGLLVWSALSTWSGTEATNAYRAGQLYNGELAHARAQAALGWQVESTVQRNADDLASIRVTIADRKTEPVTAVRVTGTLQRPTDKRADHPFELVPTEPGTYVADVSGLPAGQWDLSVDVNHGVDRLYRRITRVVLR